MSSELEYPVLASHMITDDIPSGNDIKFTFIFKLITMSSLVGFARVEAYGRNHTHAGAVAADVLYEARGECVNEEILLSCAGSEDAAHGEQLNVFLIPETIVGFEIVSVIDSRDARPA